MFTKEQEKLIYQIMTMFNDEKFKHKRLETYSNKPELLNPLEMYVIEEIYRIGHNNYYKTLASIKEDNVIDKYNLFMKKCNNDFEYELEKVKEYFKRNNNLTDLEKFCIYLILKNKEKKELLDKRSKYEYDELYEIKYFTDEELKETLANIIISMGINSILKMDDNIIRGIKERQLSKGVFTTMDKKYLIDILTSNPKKLQPVDMVVEGFYKAAKKAMIQDSDIEAFNYLFGIDVNENRTNITAREVFEETKKKIK